MTAAVVLVLVVSICAGADDGGETFHKGPVLSGGGVVQCQIRSMKGRRDTLEKGAVKFHKL